MFLVEQLAFSKYLYVLGNGLRENSKLEAIAPAVIVCMASIVSIPLLIGLAMA
jgi:hypothetical protein